MASQYWMAYPYLAMNVLSFAIPSAIVSNSSNRCSSTIFGLIRADGGQKTILFQPEQDQQGDQRDQAKQRRQINQAIEAPLAREEATESVAQKLPQTQEYRIEAHQQPAIFGRVLRNVGQIRERRRGKGAFRENAESQQQQPCCPYGDIVRTLMIQPFEGNARHEDTSYRREHTAQIGYAIEEEGPEKQTEAEEQHIRAQREAEAMAAARAAHAAHEYLM